MGGRKRHRDRRVAAPRRAKSQEEWAKKTSGPPRGRPEARQISRGMGEKDIGTAAWPPQSAPNLRRNGRKRHRDRRVAAPERAKSQEEWAKKTSGPPRGRPEARQISRGMGEKDIGTAAWP